MQNISGPWTGIFLLLFCISINTQALSTRSIEAGVFHSQQDSGCRLCKGAQETAYTERHKQVAEIVYICSTFGPEGDTTKGGWERLRSCGTMSSRWVPDGQTAAGQTTRHHGGWQGAEEKMLFFIYIIHISNFFQYYLIIPTAFQLSFNSSLQINYGRREAMLTDFNIFHQATSETHDSTFENRLHFSHILSIVSEARRCYLESNHEMSFILSVSVWFLNHPQYFYFPITQV